VRTLRLARRDVASTPPQSVDQNIAHRAAARRLACVWVPVDVKTAFEPGLGLRTESSDTTKREAVEVEVDEGVNLYVAVQSVNVGGDVNVESVKVNGAGSLMV